MPEQGALLPNDRPAGELVRPGPGSWVAYAIGRPLGSVHHEWVRRDLVTAGWRLRSMTRSLVQFAPFVLLFLVLPGQLSTRVSIAVMLVLAAVVMGLATAGYFRNQRLLAHGFAPVVPDPDDPDDPDGEPVTP